ncbi:CheR family methyltransferase [Allohahella sp. A8]|uniref:CheR family methyltransferase n=1 Tax=Allohahella sp. A8 TaxID=3141461 RepID=UPI003A8130AF
MTNNFRNDDSSTARQHQNEALETSESDTIVQASPEPTESGAYGPPIVGIGASAGGLAALKILLGTIPLDSGVAFVVVVHLSPDYESHLSSLLQVKAEIPVQQVQGEVKVEPNTVYVIPPGQNLSSIDSHLRLTKLESERRARAPVDHFFRTLSKSHDGNSAAIILTGTGSDGTLGIQEVKQKGGLTIVQDPVEAEFDGMPRSAINTGIIDIVLPLDEMVAYVLRFLKTSPRLPAAEDEPDSARPLLKTILSVVRAREGRDFSRYKQSTIMRRIRRRMQLAHLEELSDYLELLQTTPEEVVELVNDFSITVTSFFRDPEVFDELAQKVIPRLFANAFEDESIRIWSIGCSTGEEAYTLAMLMLEHAEDTQSDRAIQIFASDMHEHSLKRAREGLYPGDIETDVSQERLERFFRKENGAYRVKKEVRDLVVFSPHNFLSDPPFSRMNLIVCRNVLIYLQRTLQPDIIELFHYSLKAPGYLLLGTAETVTQSHLFVPENKTNGLYARRNVPVSEPRLPVFPFTRTRHKDDDQPKAPAPVPSYGALHHRMVERYAPPSVLVNSDNRMVHLSRRAGRYMMHPGGVPTTNIFKLVREELQVELNAALQGALGGEEPCVSRPVPLRIDGELREVTVYARRGSGDEDDDYVLIVFDERDPALLQVDAEAQDGTSAAASRELELELELTKRRLQAAIDEYETGQEEMRASNEELQSANEELRSTLEELETSKEELQSINEELQTANQENRHRVAELSQLSDDLQHLMAATHIATLFLDRKLRILRFTPQIGELFNLRTVDKGRPLSDLTHRLNYDRLMQDAEGVLKDLIPSEREVRDSQDNWYLARMRPYRTADDRIEGVVLTFFDISDHKQAELALRKSEERYRTLFESMDEAFCVVEKADENDPALTIVAANSAFHRLTNSTVLVGRRIHEATPKLLPFWQNVFDRLGSSQEAARYQCPRSVFGRAVEAHAFRLPSSHDDAHVAVLLADIDDHKRVEEALREAGLRDAFRVELADALRVSSEIEITSCRLLREYLQVDRVLFESVVPNESVEKYECSTEGHTIADDFRPWGRTADLPECFEAGRIISVDDLSSTETLSSEQQSECRKAGVQSFVTAFVHVDSNIPAALTVLSATARNWSSAERALVKEVAERTRDAIERMLAEEAVYEREQQLQGVDERKNEFLAVLSHELRNPLAPIQNAVQIIENSKTDSSAARDALAILKRQAGQMARLIDDLLDLTRIARGKIQINKQKLELNELAVSTVRDHQSLFEDKKIHLEFSPADVELWITGDDNRLSQGIGNLLQNCVKFTPVGGVTTVSLRKDGSEAVLTVTDSGIGMSPDLLNRLFQPFSQGPAALDRSNGGLGLGLALSRRFIDLHSGSITASSKGPGEGAEFIIRLALVDAPAVKVPKPEKAAVSKVRRILIIEDNVDSGCTMRDLLQLSGHEVEIVHEGQQGLEKAKDTHPDVILCDIGLPGMDGYEVARQVRSDESLNDTVLIALSGYAMPEDLERAFAAGFDHHLAKPANLQKLSSILDID